LAEALGGKGMYDEALDIYRKMFAGNAEITTALEDGFEKAGYKGAARAVADLIAERQRKTGNIGDLPVSGIYLEAGEYELAIDWYEKAFENHSPNLPLIATPSFNPLHDESLRSNPWFQEVLRKMNLPVELKE